MFNIDELKFDGAGLIPVVTQDYKDNTVLMVAYMNREAVEKTVETGKATYFSRSRNSLWLKGETSGHFQLVKEIYSDCDNDTLLLKVEQVGDIACHTGTRSCFFNKVKEFEKVEDSKKVVDKLYELILDRKKNPVEGSYTNYLFEKGLDKILKKVGEESAEVIIGAKNEDRKEMVYEISDLAYHTLILLAHFGITPDEIRAELESRKK